MYRGMNQWEEAIRVSKANGTAKEIAQVAKNWATTLGAEKGSTLLQKLGLYEAAVEYEAELGNFKLAFDMAEQYCRHRMPDIHLRFALQLEDEKRYKEAEEHFIKANKPGEAINMYEYQSDWHNAI